MSRAFHIEPAVRDSFAAALLERTLARLPDGFTLDVRIRPDGTKYYHAECVGLFWNADTLDELAADVLEAIAAPPAKSEPDPRPALDESSSPSDIIDTIEAARITGMTRHQIRSAVVKGKISQVDGLPPVSLRRGDVLEWAKRERG